MKTWPPRLILNFNLRAINIWYDLIWFDWYVQCTTTSLSYVGFQCLMLYLSMSASVFTISVNEFALINILTTNQVPKYRMSLCVLFKLDRVSFNIRSYGTKQILYKDCIILKLIKRYYKNVYITSIFP